MKLAPVVVFALFANRASEGHNEAVHVRYPASQAGAHSTTPTQPAPAAPNQAATTVAPLIVLDEARSLMSDARAALDGSDYESARRCAADLISALLSIPDSKRNGESLDLLLQAGRLALEVQDARSANAAFQRVVEARSMTLPEGHPDLLRARQFLARSLKQLGDMRGARELEESVVEFLSCAGTVNDADLIRARGNLAVTLLALSEFEPARALLEATLAGLLRTLPIDHADVLTAQAALAFAREGLGDLQGARALEQQVLDARLRTLADDHPAVQSARQTLGITLRKLGDLPAARALQEKVYDVCSRTLPDDDPDVQSARQNLSIVLMELGDLHRARELQTKALEVCSRTLPNDDPLLLRARENLAITLLQVGEAREARSLFEQVLEARSRTLRAEHPDLQRSRLNLASALNELGEHENARVLLEQTIDVFRRTLPDANLELLAAEGNLAATLQRLGDFQAARVLSERVLEARSRALPDDHHDLLDSRENLAVTLQALGELPTAKALLEEVLEVLSRTLSDDHPDVQAARHNLAGVIEKTGDFVRARALEEKVLEIRSQALPDDHPDVQDARENLAIALKELGDLDSARTLEQRVLDVRLRTLSNDDPKVQEARGNLAQTIARQVARSTQRNDRPAQAQARAVEMARCQSLLIDFARARFVEACKCVAGSSRREAEERSARMASHVSLCISFANGYGVFEPLAALEPYCFRLVEATRGAAIQSAEFERKVASDTRSAQLRAELTSASAELAASSEPGTTGAEFDKLRTRRDQAERALLDLVRDIPAGGLSALQVDERVLSELIGERDALVAFWRYSNARIQVKRDSTTGDPQIHEVSDDALCAFVVRHSRESAEQPTIVRIDLGPVGPIERGVVAWLAAIGVTGGRGVSVVAGGNSGHVREYGNELRALVFDPLLPALSGIDHLVVVPDDVLHLLPFDALPTEEASESLLGDRCRIETRSTLWELTAQQTSIRPMGGLVAIGGVLYDSPSGVAVEASARTALRETSLLAGTAWERAFPPLPATRIEIEGVADAFSKAFGAGADRVLLEMGGATKQSLLETAPKARWLHVATHGWFARSSIPSWSDPEPVDKQTGLGARLSGEAQVAGMCPLLLCGLALAGANSPVDALGRIPGLVTAEELSALDLSHCELAVLSACDSNVGERRAGQGVASLQKALQMAGAHSVITSLWKVPDEATKDLMLEFYHCLWLENKPKWRALWEAKRRLREAKDGSGHPKYTTRDWAAWVLTGDPN
jgi:CHAT domain-containing protein/tetratricopeptide (TPR) repeat protein